MPRRMSLFKPLLAELAAALEKALMQLSTRYGFAGLAGLALLSTVHWIRDEHIDLGNLGNALVGVLPNFAAAVAITFVLLSVRADQRPGDGYLQMRRWFWISASVAAVGLIGWELIQQASDRFVFDLGDILATLVGAAASGGLFAILTPKNGTHRTPRQH
jgi:hypothetical protein